jgi:hypothetical protein
MAKKKKPIPYFKARITKRINNLSRAINKIDPELQNKAFATSHAIGDIKAGINDVKYLKNGVDTKIRYDQIYTLPQREQASLLNKLSSDRYELRQERALEQLKTTGKISWQFKRSIEKNNPKLLENIQEMEFILQGNSAETIQKEFTDIDIKAGEDFMEQADTFFQTGPDMDTPELFDFFRPGESGGFSELNTFTYNAYQILKGI